MNNNTSSGSQSATNQATPPAIQYILVTLADHRYGVRLDTLQEVLRYSQLAVAPMLNSPEWLDGITSLRGTILSVVNLRAFLGLPRQTEPTKSGSPATSSRRGVARMLVVANPELTVGIVVDDLEGVLSVQPKQVKTPSAYRGDPALPYLDGVHIDLENKRKVALLNLQRLVASPQMLRFEPAYTL